MRLIGCAMIEANDQRWATQTTAAATRTAAFPFSYYFRDSVDIHRSRVGSYFNFQSSAPFMMVHASAYTKHSRADYALDN